MSYRSDRIDRAIVSALGTITAAKEEQSAKKLEAVPHIFFRTLVEDGRNGHSVTKPFEHCDSVEFASYDALETMCKRIRCDVEEERFGHHWCQLELIRQIFRKSKELMEGFSNAHAAGTFDRNPGYIRKLDDTSSWGRSMIALQSTFLLEGEQAP